MDLQVGARASSVVQPSRCDALRALPTYGSNSIRDWRIASEWENGFKPATLKMKYDDLYRPTQIDYEYFTGTDPWVDPYVAESQDSARAEPSARADFTGANRPTRQSWEYDWLGNTTKSDDDAQAFYDRSLGDIEQVRARRWDAGATPVGEPDAELQYAYDASNSRVRKSVVAGAEARHDIYIFGSLELRLAEWTGVEYGVTEQSEVVYLFAHGVRLGRVVHVADPELGSPSTRVFLELGDHLGSTSVVLDRGSGELVERSTAYAYGAPESSYRPGRWESFREDYRFTGKEDDIEVGLVYFGARYPNPLLGRWISADPLGVHAPGQADLNLYAYVHGRVLVAVDPVGLDRIFVSWQNDRDYSESLGSPSSVSGTARMLATALGAEYLARPHGDSDLVKNVADQYNRGPATGISRIDSLGHSCSGLWATQPTGTRARIWSLDIKSARGLTALVGKDKPVMLVMHGCGMMPRPGSKIPITLGRYGFTEEFMRELPVGSRLYTHLTGSGPGMPFGWAVTSTSRNESGQTVVSATRAMTGNEKVVDVVVPESYVRRWSQWMLSGDKANLEKFKEFKSDKGKEEYFISHDVHKILNEEYDKKFPPQSAPTAGGTGVSPGGK